MNTILKRLLSLYAPKRTNRKILDAGCGTGVVFPLLKSYGRVVGVDVSPEALHFAKKAGEKTIKASVMKLPFPRESFDILVSLDVLYHTWVGDYSKALNEYIRVLKSGGILLWREPAYEWLKSGHDLTDLTKRRFTKNQMMEILIDLPLEIKKISYLNFLLFPLILLFRLPSILHIEKPKAKSDIYTLNFRLNELLFAIFSSEVHLISFFSFPFGSSVISIAQKK